MAAHDLIMSAAGADAAVVNPYVEDVFSAYLYAGDGSASARAINNGLDMASGNSLLWLKSRTTTGFHQLFDTVRGVNKYVQTSATTTETTLASSMTAFNSDGFSVGNGGTSSTGTNRSSTSYLSYAFKEKDKFFKILSFTHTTGTATTIDLSSLGTVGFISIKNTSGTGAGWYCWHRGASTVNSAFNATTATTTTIISVSGTTATIASSLASATYILYAFAHNAGGFGDDGLQNVVSCGTFSATAGTVVDLGFEPQWIMIKSFAVTSNWWLVDNMRGMYVDQNGVYSQANTTIVEATTSATVGITPTGFINRISDSGSTYTYVAIRRGPMKKPTLGTNVFASHDVISGTAARTTGFPVDLSISLPTSQSGNRVVFDRLRGSRLSAAAKSFLTTTSAVEASPASGMAFDSNTSFSEDYWNSVEALSANITYFSFRRAPNVFDIACYTGTGANRTQTHNLGAIPELWIVKRRTASASDWQVGSTLLANTEYMVLNSTAAKATGATRWNSTTPTSTVFSLGTDASVNASTATYVAYLFASCPGVSKVGTYTGDAADGRVIDCGFAAGARFVLIKRTDAAGDWHVWDSVRGIFAGADPDAILNATTTPATTNDDIDPSSSGFIINQRGLGANINVSGASYIFLAIA